MKRYKIFFSFFLFLIIITGSRITSFAQQLILNPYFGIEHSTDSNFDFKINLWPSAIGSTDDYNFRDTLKVTNEFTGKKTTVTNLLVNWPIPAFFFPIKWAAPLPLPSINGAILEEPNSNALDFLRGKMSFSGRNSFGTRINTDFEYVAANEQTLLANKRVSEPFITLTTPVGDATLKFNSLNIDAATFGIKYLLFASSKHQTKTGNSYPKVLTSADYDLLNVSSPTFLSSLPAGWTPVSNVVTVAPLKKSTAEVRYRSLSYPSDLIIKYDEYGLRKDDEMNIALFVGGSGKWSRFMCKGDQGAILDTLNNTFTARTGLYGTFVLAALDKVHYSFTEVKPNTISYRFAADTLILNGSVDSTGMLQAFAGKEIILSDGFSALPGSVLSLKLTGDYCGGIKPISNSSTARKSAEQAEIQVSDEKNEIELLVFPNPTNGLITMVYNLPSPQRVRIAIKDVTGREIKLLQNGYQDESTYKQTYQTNDMSPGVYFVELITETEKLIVIKLMKQ